VRADEKVGEHGSPQAACAAVLHERLAGQEQCGPRDFGQAQPHPVDGELHVVLVRVGHGQFRVDDRVDQEFVHLRLVAQLPR
jgi:hypothetical protein